MKRFTSASAEEREFEIGGIVFKWRYPYWEDIAEVFDRDTQEIAETNGDALSVRKNIEDLQQRVELFLEPDETKKWQELVHRREGPVPHAQYSELYRWLLEVTSGTHPTEPPSPSEAGQQKTVRTSKAGSS